MIDSYKIIEAAKDARHPGDVAYFVVEFYDAGQLVLTEDFQMPHLQTTANLPVTDANGDCVLIGGEKLTKKEIADAQDAFNAAVKGGMKPEEAQVKYLDPINVKWQQVQRQTVSLGVAAQIRSNIERYMQTAGAKGIGGDRRDKTIKPSDKQLAGVSQRPEVQAMKNRAEVATPEMRAKL
jgi:hypothetical protein